MRRSILLLLLISISLASAATNTTLNISNSAPTLVQNIPNILVIYNTPSLDIIDLDDYFSDLNGDTLQFSHTSLNNITVTIDSGNRVSFYPDIGYVGIQNMQFFCSDGSANISSNIFQVSVGTDTEAPRWSNPKKNYPSVYQNYQVTFSTSWTDNVGLRDFIFSINQGSGWQNQTLTSLTGLSNISAYKVQISASAGKTVQWRFYATDIYDNQNVTDIQSFTVKEFDATSGEEYDGPEFSGGTDSGATSGGVGYGTGTKKVTYFKEGVLAENLEVNTRSIKVTMKQGSVLTKVVQLINTGNTNLKITAEIVNTKDLTRLSETEFEMSPGEKYELLVEFEIPRNQMPDQYFGFLRIDYGDDILIPIVIDVKKLESDVKINVTLTDDSKIVSQGQEVTAMIKITNLKDITSTPSTLHYAIKNFKGDILESATEEISLSQDFEEKRTLISPDNAEDGEYIFYARIVSEDSVDLDSDVFLIGARLKLIALLKKLFYPITILLLLIILAILYLTYERNKKKKKLLELYLLLNQLRGLVKEGKTMDAIEVYKRIKLTYGQHVSKGFLENESKLREELTKFSKILEKQKEETQEPAKQVPAKNTQTQEPAAQAKQSPSKNQPATPANPAKKPTPDIKKTKINQPQTPKPNPVKQQQVPSPQIKAKPNPEPSK